MKIGRNDPCPCGSGKKYKRCCLAAASPRGPYTREARSAARAKLEAFCRRGEWEAIEMAAAETFWGRFGDDMAEGRVDEEVLAQSENVFESWLWFDCRLPDGRRLVDAFLERTSELSSLERRYLQQMRGSVQRLYEIEQVVPGKSLTLRDLVSGSRLIVRERLGSQTLRRWDLIAARLALPTGASGQPEIDDLIPLPRYAKDALLTELKDALVARAEGHPSTEEEEGELFESYVPRFHAVWLEAILDPPTPKVVFSGGEEALITRVHFDVADRERVISALDEAADFFREKDEPVWQWQPRRRREAPTSLTLEADTMVLETLTRGAGERAARRVERLLKGIVQRGLTTHEELARAVKRSRREPPHHTPVDLPEADEAVLEHYERHYRAWLDDPIPALDGASPRRAARSEALRPALVELLKELERIYCKSLEMGTPGYDPSWMWEELGLSELAEAPRRRKEPPPLGHETMTRLVPGLGEVARTLAARIRRRRDFGLQTVVTELDMESDLSVRRFLEGHARKAAARGLAPQEAIASANLLGTHLECLANYDLHHRKTFWIEEGLAWMLARTNLDIHASALRLPFSSFALVFTDRDTLALGERLLSKEEHCSHRGRILQALTVYAVALPPVEEVSGLRLAFTFDDLSEDWPYLIRRDLALEPTSHLEALLESHLPDVDADEREPVFTSGELKSLVQRALNAILYATSAGGSVETRRASSKGKRSYAPGGVHDVFSSEEVFYLPGHIDIRELRQLQAVERAPGGGRLTHRFLVRGHWRRANPSWKDQSNRWIQPYWKGPQMAALVERAYRLRSPDGGP